MEISSNLRNAHFAAIVDSSDDAIISKDLNGIVTSWNPAAARIFGYSSEEMVGQPIHKLFPEDRLNEEDLILGRLRQGDRVDHFQTKRLRKDGREIDVSLTISPIRDESGGIVGASKIARDITAAVELSKQRDELLESERTLRVAAEEAHRIKDEFLATLSHELRSPLMAIQGWAQILQTGDADSDTVRRAAEVITRNTSLQSRLIDELLDMNRILMGKVRLDVQMVDLCTIINASIDSIGPTAESKHIKVRSLLDPRAGTVRGDPVRLQQIVWNLLTNAIKFTPANGTVEIFLERVNSHVELSVVDTGVGIPSDFLPRVFERFSQVDSSSTRRHGGLGLGLAIVKHLVELHGGTVVAKSAGTNKGATFRVILPFPASVQRGTADVHPHAQSAYLSWNAPDLSGRRILVVDDDRDASDLVCRILADTGAETIPAHSAEQALALLGARVFDALVSDIGMPDVDGFELIQRIRGQEGAFSQIPAIALTAFGRSEDRRNAMVAGFDVFLSKPIDATELVATVARTVARGNNVALND